MPHDPRAREKRAENLKRKARDDKMPLDEAFVRSLGWIEHGGWLYCQYDGRVSFDYQGDPCRVWITEYTCLDWLRTRGQLRRFIEALEATP